MVYAGRGYGKFLGEKRYEDKKRPARRTLRVIGVLQNDLIVEKKTMDSILHRDNLFSGWELNYSKCKMEVLTNKIQVALLLPFQVITRRIV